MREGCATGMPTPQSSGDKDVAYEIKDALSRRMGADRFRMWFGHGVRFESQPDGLTVWVDGAFALERLRSRHLADLQAAADAVIGAGTKVRMRQAASPGAAADQAAAVDEAVGVEQGTAREPTTARLIGSAAGDRPQRQERSGQESRRRQGASARQASTASPGGVPLRPRLRTVEATAEGMGDASDNGVQVPPMTLANFCVGPCNELAYTAARMVAESPGSASPIFFWGPSGTGKSHLMLAMRDQLRRRHRLRRVIQLSAEDFTNDFTTALRGSGLPAFRRRYRDVDALLIDDIHFLGGKRATLRELLYTVDTLIRSRKQLIFSADRPPLELDGLTSELAGRLAGGMVCSTNPLDTATRLSVLQRHAAAAGIALPDNLLQPLAEVTSGDGRLLSGIIHHIRAMQQMRGRLPSWDELQESAGELVRAGAPVVGLGDIQRAVCETFGLPGGALQSRGQQRVVSQPRMLAMYLARQYTRAAFSEIGGYFGKRSHSTVIAATKRVEGWLADGATLPRGGPRGMHIRQAVAAIENLLRTG